MTSFLWHWMMAIVMLTMVIVVPVLLPMAYPDGAATADDSADAIPNEPMVLTKLSQYEGDGEEEVDDD